MSKEERYSYHCDQYDYVEVIYDNEECEEIDSMKMAEERLNRQQDKISDLEAKLAESEEQLLQKERRIEDLMLCEFVATTLDFNKLSADNCRLREQLAEKEKENKQLQNELHTSKQETLHFQNKYFAEKQIAIEELQKVKEFFLKEERDEEMDTDYVITKENWEIADFLLDQIKQLRR